MGVKGADIESAETEAMDNKWFSADLNNHGLRPIESSANHSPTSEEKQFEIRNNILEKERGNISATSEVIPSVLRMAVRGGNKIDRFLFG